MTLKGLALNNEIKLVLVTRPKYERINMMTMQELVPIILNNQSRIIIEYTFEVLISQSFYQSSSHL